MKNKDTLNMTQLEIAQRISNAAKEGNSEAFEQGLQDLFQSIHDEIVDSAASFRDVADATVLAQRGVRQLTSEERKFYDTFIDALRTATKDGGSAMMALTGVDKTFPETIVNAVMDDMKQNHPLLDEVDIVNTTGMTKWIVNVDEGKTAATWGQVTDAVTQEITSGFEEIDLAQNKLSAFMPISNGLLDLGPVWLDSYIRTCLSEALALGYETGIVTGTGKNQPIGMDRSVADNVEVTGGVYPQKDKISVVDFTPANYGDLVQRLAKTQKVRLLEDGHAGNHGHDPQRGLRQRRAACPDQNHPVCRCDGGRGHPGHWQALLAWRCRKPWYPVLRRVQVPGRPAVLQDRRLR